MTLRETASAVVASLLGGFGVVMVGGVLIGVFEQTSTYTPSTDALMLTLFAGLPILLAGRIAWSLRRSARERRAAAVEAAVLRVVKARSDGDGDDRGASVSALDVAAEAGVTVAEAERCLRDLHARNFAEMDLTDEGMLVFRLPLAGSPTPPEGTRERPLPGATQPFLEPDRARNAARQPTAARDR